VLSELEGNGPPVEATVRVREVKTFETRSGNTRWVLADENGDEYTTFRPEIGRRAEEAEGKRARIRYHEQERGEFRNVYLDAVEALETEDESDDGEADEVGWRTAVEAAPWLAGEPTPDSELPADELFEKLKPFKDLVEKDIEADR
jgi:hypothetical protein